MNPELAGSMRTWAEARAPRGFCNLWEEPWKTHAEAIQKLDPMIRKAVMARLGDPVKSLAESVPARTTALSSSEPPSEVVVFHIPGSTSRRALDYSGEKPLKRFEAFCLSRSCAYHMCVLQMLDVFTVKQSEKCTRVEPQCTCSRRAPVTIDPVVPGFLKFVKENRKWMDLIRNKLDGLKIVCTPCGSALENYKAAHSDKTRLFRLLSGDTKSFSW